MADDGKAKSVDDWPGLSEWLAAYPRPDVDDDDLNMSETALVMFVSTNTIKTWLSQPGCPMPYVKLGGNGREYVLRLSWCLAWRAHQDAEKNKRDMQLAKLQGQLWGSPLDHNEKADVLSPKQIREVAEARIRHAEAGRMLGTLTEVEGVYRLLEDVLIIVRDSAMGASDRLERELSLTPAQTRRVEAVMEEMLTSMGDAIRQNVIGQDFEANTDMSRQLVNRT